MSSLLIRGLSKATIDRLKALAAKAGLSMNRYLARTLEEDILGEAKRKRVHHDLDHLMGSMNKRDYDAVCASVAEQRSIDPELWS